MGAHEVSPLKCREGAQLACRPTNTREITASHHCNTNHRCVFCGSYNRRKTRQAEKKADRRAKRNQKNLNFCEFLLLVFLELLE